MSNREETDLTRYNVVINDEEQYSIWPAHKPPVLGWREVGMSGTKQECLDYIKEHWTDMTPRTVRQQMEAKGFEN